jgi:tetratricopeptide (TPR) repeat protein/glycosyltransferase involved in cell wall biosynthesis
MSCVALIPAFCPGPALSALVEALKSEDFQGIVVIDDGSGPEFQAVFEKLSQIDGIYVLRHAINLGKGAALKAGINYILCRWPGVEGVVTADADGQHAPEDILRVAHRFLESPGSLVLGSRVLDESAPARSRVGNALTRSVLRVVLGQTIRDTQTGLRAIPAVLLPSLLAIPASGYEFELEMLMAARQLSIPVAEEPIRAIYENGNRSSHFDPLLDSMRIYFVLLRFAFIALATAAIDNAVFFVAFSILGGVGAAQIWGRSVAVLFNYAAVRKAAFRSDQRHLVVLPAYLLLVAVSGALSYAAILLLTSRLHLAVMPAKLLVETILFFGNFALQRDFIFTRRSPLLRPAQPARLAASMPLSSKLRWAALCAVLLVTACYSNHFENHFQFDDSHTIVDNPYIRSLHNIPKFFTDAGTFSTIPANRTWRPLVSTSLAIDYWLGGGLKPLWFHISTFFWFLVQLAILFLLFRAILRRAGDEWWTEYGALFAAAWFGVHPAMAETVNYIIQRGDLYATLGVTASLAAFAMFPRARKTRLYLLPAALGILAKPPAAIFPAILFTYIWLFEEDANPRRALAALRQCWAAILVAAFLLVVEVRMTPPSYTAGAISAKDYILTQPFVALHYFLSFFLPFGLTADTDLSAIPSPWTTEALTGMAFCAAVVLVIVKTAKAPRTRPISFGLLWFLLALLPTALYPLAEVENDHRMFMPFAGLVLAVSWTLALCIAARPKLRTPAIACGAMLVLVAYAQGAWQRNRVWHTEESLWKDVTLKSPRNGRGLMNYGLSLMSQGRTAEAAGYFEKAAEFTPNYYILEINRAIACAALGNDRDATAHFLRAMRLAPADALPYYYYGRWLHQKNRLPEATALLRASVAKNEEYFPARYELMRIYAATGNTPELRALAAGTLRIAPGDPWSQYFLRHQSQATAAQTTAAGSYTALEARAGTHPSPETDVELSLAYYRAGRFQDCVEAARRATKLKPDYPEAWNNVAACSQSLAQWDDAIEAAKVAIRLRPDFQLAKNNLAYSVQQRARASESPRTVRIKR